ncbi:MAG: hypothetical protein PHV36_08645 [Elusimicrobiales bacterium]|nr:hypothetical protein [Elusimicrobiales bacterium]
MKKSKILIALFAVIIAAASTVKAEGIKLKFDGEGNDKNGASLRDVIEDVSVNSGIQIPEIPARRFDGDMSKPAKDSNTELLGITSQGKGDKIYLEAIQAVLKRRLLDAYKTNAGVLSAVNANGTKILFDTEEICITSADYNVYVELKDPVLLKEFALLIPAKNKGVCTTIITVGKKCNTWAQLICTAWELYNIYTEICPPSAPSTPPAGGGGGNGGAVLPPLPLNPPVRSAGGY